MKNKFTLEINKPCSENFDKMTLNSAGSFCSSCAKNVIDLSKKSNSEIAKFISENKDQNICARLKTSQLEDEFEYNQISKINNFKYAAIAATVLLTSSVVGQEAPSITTEMHIPESDNHIMGKIALHQPEESEILITLKGKLLDSKTNKPLDPVKYPNVIFTINSGNQINFNPKTGEFTAPLRVLKNSKSIMITVESRDFYLSKTIPLDIESGNKTTIKQDILIDTEELLKVYILGGLGINYTDKKVSKEV